MKLIMIGSLGELKKGAWSPEEDQRLMAYVEKHGSKSWCQMPKAAGLARSGKSCRFRWVNYLRPDLKRGRLTMNEIQTIITFHKSLGNQWTKIAEHLPGRTDNEIKNFWYLNMKKNSKPITKKNPPIKSNKTKRENRKVDKENISLLNTYASDEIYSEMNSSASSSIIDFPIAESYSSPSKDSYSSSIKTDTIVCPSVSHQGRQQVQDSFGEPFWIEDVVKSSMLFTTNFQDRSTSSHNAIDSPDSKSTSQFDESTSFWFNILINAEKLGGK